MAFFPSRYTLKDPTILIRQNYSKVNNDGKENYELDTWLPRHNQMPRSPFYIVDSHFRDETKPAILRATMP
jgi:hypothetical protein